MSLLFSTGVIAASGLAKGAPGMVLLTPTSITHSGTSASIGANGQVTFTAVTSLSLNGVFSADFDNYVVSMQHRAATTDPGVLIRYRASGSDASGSDYTWQKLEANGTTINGARTSSTTSIRIGDSSTNRAGTVVNIYGPFMSQPTAVRCVTSIGYLGAYIFDTAGTHGLSTSYDGITVFPSSDSISGTLTVMGVRS